MVVKFMVMNPRVKSVKTWPSTNKDLMLPNFEIVFETYCWWKMYFGTKHFLVRFFPAFYRVLYPFCGAGFLNHRCSILNLQKWTNFHHDPWKSLRNKPCYTESLTPLVGEGATADSFGKAKISTVYHYGWWLKSHTTTWDVCLTWK